MVLWWFALLSLSLSLSGQRVPNPWCCMLLKGYLAAVGWRCSMHQWCIARTGCCGLWATCTFYPGSTGVGCIAVTKGLNIIINVSVILFCILITGKDARGNGLGVWHRWLNRGRIWFCQKTSMMFSLFVSSL